MWVILLTGCLYAYTVQDFRHAEKFLIGGRVVLHQYSPVVCPIISLSSVKVCMNTAAMLSRRCFHCLLRSSFAQDFLVYGNQGNTTTCLSGWSCLLMEILQPPPVFASMYVVSVYPQWQQLERVIVIHKPGDCFPLLLLVTT